MIKHIENGIIYLLWGNMMFFYTFINSYTLINYCFKLLHNLFTLQLAPLSCSLRLCGEKIHRMRRNFTQNFGEFLFCILIVFTQWSFIDKLSYNYLSVVVPPYHFEIKLNTMISDLFLKLFSMANVICQ